MSDFPPVVPLDRCSNQDLELRRGLAVRYARTIRGRMDSKSRTEHTELLAKIKLIDQEVEKRAATPAPPTVTSAKAPTTPVATSAPATTPPKPVDFMEMARQRAKVTGGTLTGAIAGLRLENPKLHSEWLAEQRATYANKRKRA